MATAATILVLLVAASQAWCMIMEMFLWRTPIGVGNYCMTQDFANSSATLAANKGLYQGFLAAGLVWSVIAAPQAFALQAFCLACSAAAGAHCAATVSRRFFFLQTLPATLALALVIATR